MRGSIHQRSKGSWRIRIDAEQDPKTGKTRKQLSVTVRGRKEKAEAKLREMMTARDNGMLVEPSKLTLGEWLTKWLASQKPHVREATYVRYKGIIDNDILKAPIATLPVQKLRASNLESYYDSLREKRAGSTLALHHTILQQALRKAMRDRIIPQNPAIDLDGKPRRSQNRYEDARLHAWTIEEARAFLQAAKEAGPQPAAFYSLALDTGMRKGELCGLRWSDVDLDGGKVRVVHQLLSPTVDENGEPKFGPTKTGKPRTISISDETVELLRAHKSHQAEVKMANRLHYTDLGLVFAKEWSDVRKHEDVLGQPLQMNNLGQREYTKLIKAAGVRPIKFHGLRHTCATLLLKAGEPVHVVSERLGHSKVSMTMEVYAHVLPDMQKQAATKLGAMLHG